MPYTRRGGRFERARSTGHSPIVDNALVQERLRQYRIFSDDDASPIDPELLVSADDLEAPLHDPTRWVFAFDGSPYEVAVRDEYPSTRVGYVQVAGVLVQLSGMMEQSDQRLVDPAMIREMTREAMHGIVLPGSNIVRPDMSTVRDSWRAEIYDIFRIHLVEDRSLLDVFAVLITHSEKQIRGGGILLARCAASEECTERNIAVPLSGRVCPGCGGYLFPTDALRIHEEVTEEHENLAALGRLMTCLEHLTLVAYLQYLARRQPRVLGTTAFLLDGPLALFGPQAWLHTPILDYIHTLSGSLARQGYFPPVIAGLEKGGQFAEHARLIGDRIPRRTIMMLPDEYIYRHILTFRPAANATFGRDTYYGQKFVYRTAQGQLLTITVPKIIMGVPDPHDPGHYSCLPDTLALLDRIGTNLYQDAVIPIALAHSFASIPLRTGSRVLTLLSKELLSSNHAH